MVKRGLSLVALVPALLVLLGSMSPQQGTVEVPGHVVTVPIHLDHNRVYIDATLTGPTGRSKKTVLWVDTGSRGLTISASLARDLELAVTSSSQFGNTVETPQVSIGGTALDTGGVQVDVYRDDAPGFPGQAAEALIGMAILSHYTVVFDYPQRQFSLLAVGSTTKRGVAIDIPIKPQLYPTIAVAIDGQKYDMLLDTGASYTMFAEGITKALSWRHRDWAMSLGAVGLANMGIPGETSMLMLQLPQIELSTISLQNVGVVTRSDETWQTFSNYTAVPVVGSLAGNVLRHFRLELDYQAGKAYLEQSASVAADPMTMIGLSLTSVLDGSWHIAGVSDRQPVPAGQEVLPGDQLISVDGTAVAGLTWGSVTDTLRGRAGTVKTLVLDRQGNRVTVRLAVSPILPGPPPPFG